MFPLSDFPSTNPLALLVDYKSPSVFAMLGIELDFSPLLEQSWHPSIEIALNKAFLAIFTSVRISFSLTIVLLEDKLKHIKDFKSLFEQK